MSGSKASESTTTGPETTARELRSEDVVDDLWTV